MSYGEMALNSKNSNCGPGKLDDNEMRSEKDASKGTKLDLAASRPDELIEEVYMDVSEVDSEFLDSVDETLRMIDVIGNDAENVLSLKSIDQSMEFTTNSVEDNVEIDEIEENLDIYNTEINIISDVDSFVRDFVKPIEKVSLDNRKKKIITPDTSGLPPAKNVPDINVSKLKSMMSSKIGSILTKNVAEKPQSTKNEIVFANFGDVAKSDNKVASSSLGDLSVKPKTLKLGGLNINALKGKLNTSLNKKSASVNGHHASDDAESDDECRGSSFSQSSEKSGNCLSAEEEENEKEDDDMTGDDISSEKKIKKATKKMAIKNKNVAEHVNLSANDLLDDWLDSGDEETTKDEKNESQNENANNLKSVAIGESKKKELLTRKKFSSPLTSKIGTKGTRKKTQIASSDGAQADIPSISTPIIKTYSRQSSKKLDDTDNENLSKISANISPPTHRATTKITKKYTLSSPQEFFEKQLLNESLSETEIKLCCSSSSATVSSESDNQAGSSDVENISKIEKIDTPSSAPPARKKASIRKSVTNVSLNLTKKGLVKKTPGRKPKASITNTPVSSPAIQKPDGPPAPALSDQVEWKVGDVIWGRVGHYPFWPCLVTLDPDHYEDRYVKRSVKNSLAVHVRFFGDKGRRSWVPAGTGTLPFKGRKDFYVLREAIMSDNRKENRAKAKFYNVNKRDLDVWENAIVEATNCQDLPVELRMPYFDSVYGAMSFVKEEPLSSDDNSTAEEDVTLSTKKRSLSLAGLSGKPLIPVKRGRKSTKNLTPDGTPKVRRSVGRRPKNKQLNASLNNTSSSDSIEKLSMSEILMVKSNASMSDTNTPTLPKKIEIIGSIDDPSTYQPAIKTESELVCSGADDSSETASECDEFIPKTSDKPKRKFNKRKCRVIADDARNVKMPKFKWIKKIQRPKAAKVGVKSLTPARALKKQLSVYEFTEDEGIFSPSMEELKRFSPNVKKLDSTIPAMKEPCGDMNGDKVGGSDADFEVFYMRFGDRVADEHPEMKGDEIRKYLRNMWDELDSKQRIRYKMRAPIKKVREEVERKPTSCSLLTTVDVVASSTQDVTSSSSASSSQSASTSAIKKISPSSSRSQSPISIKCSKRMPNLFAGVEVGKICQVCQKPGAIRCRGPCAGYFHLSCEEGTSGAVSSETTKPVTKVILVSDEPPVKRKRGRPFKKSITNVNDATATSDVSMTTLDASTTNGAVATVEGVENGGGNGGQNREENCGEKKEENVGGNGDQKREENVDANGGQKKEENVDANGGQKKEENGGGNVVGQKKEENGQVAEFRCRMCTLGQTRACFVCNDEIKDAEKYRCSLPKCGKIYHRQCLKNWPQSTWNAGKAQRSGIVAADSLMCPQHFCHTCISDNPSNSKDRLNAERIVRCIRCPTSYHSSAYCIPAGSEILTTTQIVCPRHYVPRNRKVNHFNTSWCFVCAIGGSLICCDQCPLSIHAECINLKPEDYEDVYICEDCFTGRYPLYGDIVWVKHGHYRWWPARILFPNEIPDNILNLPHHKGEFAVKFFGSHDHNWLNRGRVFLYQEGDNMGTGSTVKLKTAINQIFQRAVNEATEAHLQMQFDKATREFQNQIGLKPPRYVSIKVNKPVGNVRSATFNASSSTACECSPQSEHPCGIDSNCVNRALCVECNPTVCAAGENCENQNFEKRLYPRLTPFKTEHRGWGLKTLQDIKKGQFVIEYVGELISEDEYNRRMERMLKNRDENFYFLNIDKDRMLDAGPRGNVSRFMNHSCNPNCEAQKWTVNSETRIGLFAKMDIPANSELVFNYNLYSNCGAKKKCNCGADNCSGFIGIKTTKTTNGNGLVKEDAKKGGRRGNLGKKRRKIVRRKKKLEEVGGTVVCFVCKEEGGGSNGALVACDGKLCHKSYHLKCVGKQKRNPGKWLCPSHYCCTCGIKEKVTKCRKCINSYCEEHAYGFIKQDAQTSSYLCYKHSADASQVVNDHISKIREKSLETKNKSGFMPDDISKTEVRKMKKASINRDENMSKPEDNNNQSKSHMKYIARKNKSENFAGIENIKIPISDEQITNSAGIENIEIPISGEQITDSAGIENIEIPIFDEQITDSAGIENIKIPISDEQITNSAGIENIEISDELIAETENNCSNESNDEITNKKETKKNGRSNEIGLCNGIVDTPSAEIKYPFSSKKTNNAKNKNIFSNNETEKLSNEKVATNNETDTVSNEKVAINNETETVSNEKIAINGTESESNVKGTLNDRTETVSNKIIFNANNGIEKISNEIIMTNNDGKNMSNEKMTASNVGGKESKGKLVANRRKSVKGSKEKIMTNDDAENKSNEKIVTNDCVENTSNQKMNANNVGVNESKGKMMANRRRSVRASREKIMANNDAENTSNVKIMTIDDAESTSNEKMAAIIGSGKESKGKMIANRRRSVRASKEKIMTYDDAENTSNVKVMTNDDAESTSNVKVMTNDDAENTSNVKVITNDDAENTSNVKVMTNDDAENTSNEKSAAINGDGKESKGKMIANRRRSVRASKEKIMTNDDAKSTPNEKINTIDVGGIESKGKMIANRRRSVRASKEKIKTINEIESSEIAISNGVEYESNEISGSDDKLSSKMKFAGITAGGLDTKLQQDQRNDNL